VIDLTVNVALLCRRDGALEPGTRHLELAASR
jgi:hypothetical protein